jgi:hypothetical protein
MLNNDYVQPLQASDPPFTKPPTAKPEETPRSTSEATMIWVKTANEKSKELATNEALRRAVARRQF